MKHIAESGKLFRTVIIVNYPGRTRRQSALAFIFSGQLQTLLFAGVMVEPESAARYIGNVCEDIFPS
jgi:hypothetical protein